ncbi:hypothetical protein TNCT_344191 [Trichonephila clavata]|uniref:Uncharacterized protein n=1 Tax=Trichonephila clavata TaxID=2740835 RepID=A0A8X6FQ57_TRICU|nr:hypothetical protein TNCT_344191 [Trichonephila clavata]
MTDTSTEKKEFSENNNELQKDKEIYNLLKADCCVDRKIKVMDCFKKSQGSALPVNEVCNKELLHLIKGVNECLEKARKGK